MDIEFCHNREGARWFRSRSFSLVGGPTATLSDGGSILTIHQTARLYGERTWWEDSNLCGANTSISALLFSFREDGRYVMRLVATGHDVSKEGVVMFRDLPESIQHAFRSHWAKNRKPKKAA